LKRATLSIIRPTWLDKVQSKSLRETQTYSPFPAVRNS